MVNVKEAKSILFKNVNEISGSLMEVKNCSGFVLAENIYSPVHLPPFNQSAMDGFAVNIKGFGQNDPISLPLVGEIKAGGKPVDNLKNGTAMYIYTGAPAPSGTSVVVIQEKTQTVGNNVTFPVSAIKAGANIRLKGSQIKKGELALSKGIVLNPAAIGFMSSMGLTVVKVIPKPLVALLTTGSELKKPGTKLLPGQIYEANSFTLSAAIRQSGFNTGLIKSVSDNQKLILKHIEKMIEVSDVIIISGGISVGKYDLVKDSLVKIGVQQIFYKVSQKPGKPLFAGKFKNKIVFALPGNPAAALVCFYEYVYPVLRKMSGMADFGLKQEFFPIAEQYELKGDRDLFLKAKVENGKVSVMEGQESNILKSFACSNALVYLNGRNRVINKGEPVETHLLPF